MLANNAPSYVFISVASNTSDHACDSRSCIYDLSCQIFQSAFNGQEAAEARPGTLQNMFYQGRQGLSQ